MQGNKDVIVYFNKILRNELTAINQYFLHSRILGDWGLESLEKHEYDESIDEMKHADAVIKRVLFLEGLPNLQDLGKLRIGENVKEIFQGDLDLELDALKDLREGIACCEENRDYASRELMEEILAEEEEHVDWLETNLALLDKIGEKNYLQSKMGS